MRLKNILSLLTIFCISLGGFACSKDDDGVKNNVALKTVGNEETEGIQVNSETTSASFSVYSSVTPVVSTDQPWISGVASEPSLMNSISRISLTLEENNSEDSRSANVTVTSGNQEIVVRVTQEGGEFVNPGPSVPDDPTDEVQPLLGIKAQDIARDIKAGWNIGNTLEAIGGETAWGNPLINESYIDGVKAAGFNAVRIPCAWDQYISDRSTNELKSSWLDRVNEVVGWVLARDMYAIINIHWDGGWLENKIGNAATQELLEKQKTLWTQIAKRLGHYNERLMFAGLNEPNAEGAEGAAALLEYEQAFIDAVRATGGNNEKRTLIFQGPNTDISKTYENFKTNPVDPAGEGYLMAEIHYYDPYQYTIMEKDENWGKVAWFWGQGYHVEGSDRNSTWGEEDWMKEKFNQMKEQFVDNNIPVIIGEYGAYPESHYANEQTEEDKEAIKASRIYYYRCVETFARERGLIPFVCDTGELINRNDGRIKNPDMIEAIVGATR